MLVCTNGHHVLTEEQKETFNRNGIQVNEDPITALIGTKGMLERVVFATGEESICKGGFVAPQLIQASSFGSLLECDMNAMDNIVIDAFGRTSVKGVYAAGDIVGMPFQLIMAAMQGSIAAAGVNTDLIQSEFL